jgi:hypothetical protein
MPAALSNLSEDDLHTLADGHAIQDQDQMDREQLIVALRPITGEMVDGFESDPSITPPEPVPPAPVPVSSEGSFADPNNNPSDLATRSDAEDAAEVMAATEGAGSIPAPDA